MEEPIKINIVILENNRESVRSINVRITNKLKMLELLNQSIEMFNEMFCQYGYLFELNKNSSLYSIKPSKKSGKPDNDLPSK